MHQAEAACAPVTGYKAVLPGMHRTPEERESYPFLISLRFDNITLGLIYHLRVVCCPTE